MNERSGSVPIWVWGAVVGVLLILISSRSHLFTLDNAPLSQYFAAQPTAEGFAPGFQLPQLEISALPAGLQTAARDLLATLGAGGVGRPVEPAVESRSLRVEVRELKRVEGGLQVRGEVTNLSGGELLVPISAFELRDSTGASYVAGGGASATLKPGESTPLDLTVPLPEGRGLLLVTNLPPDPSVEQRLIVVEG